MNLSDAVAEMERWEDVSVELYTRGVTGRPTSACNCPVANYLKGLGFDVTVIPNGGETDGYIRELHDDFTSTEHPISRNVSDFALAFDAGKHPELVTPNVGNS